MYTEVKTKYGVVGVNRLLTPPGGNAKTKKSTAKTRQYRIYALHLAPSNMSGAMNTCIFASNGCRKACLNLSGRSKWIWKDGRYNKIHLARIAKTVLFSTRREVFMAMLVSDIESAWAKCLGIRKILAVRLNATSDLRWELFKCWRNGKRYNNLMEAFPEVVFYDYTKDFKRIYSVTKWPSNYHLTYSRSEDNEHAVIAGLKEGDNVAVVFDKIPKTWNGFEVVSGEHHDIRIPEIDGYGVVIGLLAKSKAKTDKSGFVVRSKTCILK